MNQERNGGQRRIWLWAVGAICIAVGLANCTVGGVPARPSVQDGAGSVSPEAIVQTEASAPSDASSPEPPSSAAPTIPSSEPTFSPEPTPTDASALPSPEPAGAEASTTSVESSVRFFGNGRDAIDRITIPIDAPERPADVGATDFTIEFWIKAEPGVNTGSVACDVNDGWITGNIFFDRDIYFAGDYGDFGIALNNGAIAFGLSVGDEGTTLCGARTVADGRWHHVAVTRSLSGEMAIFVDGQPDGFTAGAAGDASYRNGRSTDYPWDPYIVLGAEKHDAGPEYPSFNGWLDELRISTTVRYTAAFQPPTAPFVPDVYTAALYHFDEGAGTTIADSAGAPGGPSDGVLRVGGDPAGPAWSDESPFRR
ncbi:MAG: LamG-like jellyroll fold domain-containing protein [Caldilinea sp.]|uniref:LamG-like jellyroll fold domain-containing protein n=1 Tax=Caldilinea sp. TaxID=2293560 RepID=UPI0030A51E15